MNFVLQKNHTSVPHEEESTDIALEKHNEIKMSNVEWISQRLYRAFPNAQVQIEDTRSDDQHLCATIISEDFSGKTRLVCHQMVYAALEDMRQGKIHALTLRTRSI